MNKLYKFFWDCGRSGYLEGLFVATEEEIQQLKGQTVYFGEVLGKHSDVYGTIDDGDIEEVTSDQHTINTLVKYAGHATICGYSPFDYYEPDDEEDDDDEDYFDIHDEVGC